MPQRRSQWKASIFNDIAKAWLFTPCYPYQIR